MKRITILIFIILSLSTVVFSQDKVPDTSYLVTPGHKYFCTQSDVDYVVKILSVMYPKSTFSTVDNKQQYRITVRKEYLPLKTAYYLEIHCDEVYYDYLNIFE